MRMIAILLSLALISPANAAPETIVPPVTRAPTADELKLVEHAVLDNAAGKLVALLKGDIAPESYFTDEFLAAVPSSQVLAISRQIIAQYGQPLALIEVTKTESRHAILKVAFEKAVGTFNITIDGKSHTRVAGLVATDFVRTDDSIEKVTQAFTALPGKSSFLVQSLNADGAKLGFNSDFNMAIGSIFKLYILAELATEIEAGERKWTDLVPLTEQSFSSPKTTKMAKGTKVSLKDLATWMISVSDNGAADTLLRLLGRSKVEQKLALVGHSNPERILPFLSTVEAFALKAPANTKLRKRYLSATEKQQRAFLTTQAKNLNYAKIDSNTFTNGPVHIDTIEWFASAHDIGRILNNIRQSGSKTALDILAINPGTSFVSAEKWSYLGYKGGSEPGVMAMSYLGQTKSGEWKIISGAWNNPAKEVDQEAFADLMGRLVSLAVQ